MATDYLYPIFKWYESYQDQISNKIQIRRLILLLLRTTKHKAEQYHKWTHTCISWSADLDQDSKAIQWGNKDIFNLPGYIYGEANFDPYYITYGNYFKIDHRPNIKAK